MMVLAMAGATCAAALLTAGRVFGFKRLVKHSTATDVTFTLGTVAILGGTLTGATVAILAGLMMALFLTMCKSTLGMLDKVSAAVGKACDVADEWVVPAKDPAHKEWKQAQGPVLIHL